jgi:hypothetical protein
MYGQTDRQTDRQTERGNTICLPVYGGDIMTPDGVYIHVLFPPNCMYEMYKHV